MPDVDNLLFPTSSELEQVTVPTPATSGSPDISPTNSELPPGAWGAFSYSRKILIYLMILHVVGVIPVGDRGTS